MSKDTCEAILYGQLQGLRLDLMRSPSVSGALAYQELIMAAKNEEQRQSVLRKRRTYQSTFGVKEPGGSKPGGSQLSGSFQPRPRSDEFVEKRTCYKCHKTGHISKHCHMKKTESKGSDQQRDSNTRQVQTEDALGSRDGNPQEGDDESTDPLAYLFSSEEDSVKLVHVQDHGSHSRLAKVSIQGFPVEGIVDSGADITIINGDLFKKIATAAHLKKKNFKPADKLPRAYNRQPFTLDGRMDLEVAFSEKAMVTPIYIKMKAHDPLLLSEGVCRQLGILTYHPDVRCSVEPPSPESSSKAVVPMVRVQLLKAVKLLPRQSIQVAARVGEATREGTWLLEPDSKLEEIGVGAQESLITAGSEAVQVVLTNATGLTQHLEEDTVIGSVNCVHVISTDPSQEGPAILSVSSGDAIILNGGSTR